MQTTNPIISRYEKQIASYWDNKTDDAINLDLAYQDSIIHHHFGIGKIKKDISLFSQDEIRDELHRLENNQTLLAINLMRDIDHNHTVLDAGSGRGGTAFMIHQILKCDVLGVNTSGYQVTYANNLASDLNLDNHVRFIFNNMERMDIQDGSIDAIITNETTMYIKKLKNLYAEFGRVLKKGGIYVNATWCKNELHMGEYSACDEIENHYLVKMHYRNDYLKSLLQAGFIPFSMWDFSEDAVPYWQLRSRFIHKTGIEYSFLKAYENKEMAYVMIGAYKF